MMIRDRAAVVTQTILLALDSDGEDGEALPDAPSGKTDER
jgi:hypothetical protein